MKTKLFSVSFVLFMVNVRSESTANMDYFIMTEAHISEYRANEDANGGYAPFYIECSTPAYKHSCWPAVPKMNAAEGYVTFEKSYWNTKIFYGCPQQINLEIVLNPENHFQKALIMKRAKSTSYMVDVMIPFVNLYKHRCTSELFPVLWMISPIQEVKMSYGIGFLVPGLDEMPIAEVYYDHRKNIPIWTKHTLYGVSLAAPTRTFKSLEEIVYHNEWSSSHAVYMKTALEYNYSNFNEENSMTRGEVNMKLMLRGLAKIPDTSKIVMGHLIPEYDMIMSNWQKVSQVAETIVPTWEELYLNEWVDVEEMIREESFMTEKKLIVYSGTHGQLIFDVITADETQEKSKFYLGKTVEVAVPEIIWKVVIDETSDKKKATVIIFRNLTEQLEKLKIFTKFTPPCNSKCSRLQRKINNQPNKLIYCCKVDDVKNKIEELPDYVINGNFEILIK